MDAKALYELSKAYLAGNHSSDEDVQMSELLNVLQFLSLIHI